MCSSIGSHIEILITPIAVTLLMTIAISVAVVETAIGDSDRQKSQRQYRLRAGKHDHSDVACLKLRVLKGNRAAKVTSILLKWLGYGASWRVCYS